MNDINLLNDGIYLDEQDKQRHFRTMRSLVDETEHPFEEVAPMYESVLQDLQEHARIQDYLPVLVAKRIKHAYNQG